jgi:predicted DNA-binding transcriptional regulator YafY
VSLRTVHRDLDVLRMRGVPVEADRGRGGGVRLPSSWGIGRVRLTRAETLDLLIGLAIGESAHATMQMSHVDAIRRKLLASFSHADQRQIGALRRRIRVGGTASGAVLSTLGPTPQQVSDPLKEAFVLGRVLSIHYQDGKSALTEREIEPHFLLLNPPIWYAVCWDHLRQQNRTFRCDRMRDATLTNQSFTPRPWSEFEASMAGNPTRTI